MGNCGRKVYCDPSSEDEREPLEPLCNAKPKISISNLETILECDTEAELEKYLQQPGIDKLPPVILARILSLLAIPDRARLRRVCREWNRITPFEDTSLDLRAMFLANDSFSDTSRILNALHFLLPRLANSLTCLSTGPSEFRWTCLIPLPTATESNSATHCHNTNSAEQPTIQAYMARQCPNLTSIHTQRFPLKGLAEFSTLETLFLDNLVPEQASTADVLKLNFLSYIELAKIGVREIQNLLDIGLKSLGLKKLGIYGGSVDMEQDSLHVLCENCRMITHLTLDDCGPLDFGPLVKLKHLGALEIRNKPFSRSDTGITNLPGLRETCKELSQVLTSLKINHYSCLFDFQFLVYPANLKLLDLANCAKFNSELLELLPPRAPITSLNLSGTKALNDKTLNFIMGRGLALTFLGLSLSDPSNSYLARIGNWSLKKLLHKTPSLEHLWIAGHRRISDDIFDSVLRYGMGLKFLDTSDTGCSLQGFKTFLQKRRQKVERGDGIEFGVLHMPSSCVPNLDPAAAGSLLEASQVAILEN